MDKVDTHKCLTRYGTILKDINLDTSDGCHRVSIFEYQNKLYYRHMHDGEIVECHEIKADKEESKC